MPIVRDFLKLDEKTAVIIEKTKKIYAKHCVGPGPFRIGKKILFINKNQLLPDLCCTAN